MNPAQIAESEEGGMRTRMTADGVKTYYVAFYCTGPMHRAIRAAANSNGRTISEELRSRIERSLQRDAIENAIDEMIAARIDEIRLKRRLDMSKSTEGE